MTPYGASAEVVALRGITWDNDRGARPLLAAAESWNAEHPSLPVEVHVRPLREFAHASLEPLMRAYDFVIFDHPHVGEAIERGLLAPLDAFLDESEMRVQRETVGPTFASYRWEGQSWAFGIDAACQIAARRPDLASPGKSSALASNWHDVVAFADEAPAGKPRVALPFIPVLAGMSFLTMCSTFGEPPFLQGETVVPTATGVQALELLSFLIRRSHPASLEIGDVEALELLTTTDEVSYLPLVFGYSNYARDGYRSRAALFEPAAGTESGRGGAILGGAGLGVSAFSPIKERVMRFGVWLSSPSVQSGLYLQHYGQPAHRQAWQDPAADALVGGFFSSTRSAIEGAYLRPRYAGFVQLQEKLGEVIQESVLNGRDPATTLDDLNEIYRQNAGEGMAAVPERAL